MFIGVPNYFGITKLLRVIRELRREEERLSLTFQSLAEQPPARREQFRQEVAALNERAARVNSAFDRLTQNTFVSA